MIIATSKQRGWNSKSNLKDFLSAVYIVLQILRVSTINFFQFLRNLCEQKNVIITGDFNSNMLDNSGKGKKFKDVLQLVNFKYVY